MVTLSHSITVKLRRRQEIISFLRRYDAIFLRETLLAAQVQNVVDSATKPALTPWLAGHQAILSRKVCARNLQEWAKSPVSLDCDDVLKCPTVFRCISARKNLLFVLTWISTKLFELKDEIGPGLSRGKRVATSMDKIEHTGSRSS
jgi:hypothetical protein